MIPDNRLTPTERLSILAMRLNVIAISDIVLKDPRFPLWSGSSVPEKHHYGKGLLAEHTCEVAELCLCNNEYFPLGKKVNDQQLFLAALFHDVGKMWDYRPIDDTYKEWEGTTHKRMIHHISRSALVWQEAASKFSFLWDKDEVLHAILAHHGMREWGSPVSPGTRLAWLLHLCDGISARMDDALRRGHP